MQKTRTDVAIVGAGFAGPILAAKIAEKGVHPRTGDRLKVALVEAGPYLKGTPRPGYGSPVRRHRFTNMLYSDPAFHWENGLAKMVGGTSLHWAAQAFLPFPMDYIHWQKETGVDWTEENFKDAVAEIRREFNVHSFPDEIGLTRGNKLFYDVARKMGYDPQPQETARRNCIHCGFSDARLMCKYDSKASTLVTYVPIAEEHGVDILADTWVEKILIDVNKGRGVARGLICRSQGSTYELEAEKVIVCCGYLETPMLLMRSGYGPREWRGNPIMVENPNIGKHIDGHPRTPSVTALFDEPLGDGEHWSIGGPFFIHDDRADGEGRLLFYAGFGTNDRPAAAALNRFAPDFGWEHKKFMKENGILRISSFRAGVAKPSGRWHIDPDGKILYGGDHSLTIRRAREGLEMCHEVLKQMGARKLTSTNVAIKYPPNFSGSHLSGSCRAGVDPKTSVVNPHFESHDVDNLFLCDGSVIPRVTTGNSGTPNASVAVFAAGRIIERHFS